MCLGVVGISRLASRIVRKYMHILYKKTDKTLALQVWSCKMVNEHLFNFSCSLGAYYVINTLFNLDVFTIWTFDNCTVYKFNMRYLFYDHFNIASLQYQIGK